MQKELRIAKDDVNPRFKQLCQKCNFDISW